MLYMEYKELKRFLTFKQIDNLESDGSIEWVEYHESFRIHNTRRVLNMRKLKAKTIRKLATKAIELDKEQQLRRHHLVWILERIAGQGDGYLPKELDKIVKEDHHV